MASRSAHDRYIETALWSSTDDDGDPLDEGQHDLSDEARSQMGADVERFFNGLSELGLDLSGHTDERIAHDFWLTRNGHGAGFWDGDYADLGEENVKLLTDIAKAFGSSDLYVGDDGEIYVS